MRNLIQFYVVVENGKKRVIWSLLMVFLLMVHGVEIGLAEVFWKLFAGDYSWLVGGYALVLAVLTSIRLVATAIYEPAAWVGPALNR